MIHYVDCRLDKIDDIHSDYRWRHTMVSIRSPASKHRRQDRCNLISIPLRAGRNIMQLNNNVVDLTRANNHQLDTLWYIVVISWLYAERSTSQQRVANSESPSFVFLREIHREFGADDIEWPVDTCIVAAWCWQFQTKFSHHNSNSTHRSASYSGLRSSHQLVQTHFYCILIQACKHKSSLT